MSNSPAWDDINPAVTRSAKPHGLDCRVAAQQFRKLTEFAAQLIHEGQIDRARDYLRQAVEVVEELR